MNAHRWVDAWWRGQGGLSGSLLDVLLWPAEGLYTSAIALRNRGYDRGMLSKERAAIPVVSVGNLTVGGTGKTPFSAWLAGRLEQRGDRPAIVLRGYGDDEILVHRELNPGVVVIAARRRADGVVTARNAGCTVVVLDDGFQHRVLERDLDLVLVSAESWLTTRARLLPRGPWREPLHAAERADLVVVTRKSASDSELDRVRAELQRGIGDTVAVETCDLVPAELVALASGRRIGFDELAGQEVLAAAGLATPGPFVRQLVALGMETELVSFPDHHRFTPADADTLVKRAGGRAIIMTLKDAVKLRDLLPASAPAYMVRQEVVPTPGLETALVSRLATIGGEAS